MANPAAKPLIDEMKIPIEYCALAGNPADWAMDLLFGNGIDLRDMNGDAFCANPNPRVIAYLLANPERIDKEGWNRNPGAIEHLRANPNFVCASIYANPGIFELTVSKELIDVLMQI
jgi:hypothetical protein